MADLLLPNRLLHKIGAGYPDFWKGMDAMRGLKGKGRDWPDAVFLPLAAVQTLVAERGQITPVTEQHVPILAGLGAWRPTQGVYRFDPDHARHLMEQVDLSRVPLEMLLRLPEWCCYLDLEGLGIQFPGPGDLQVMGAFVHAEHDGRSTAPLPQYFQVLVADSDMGLVPLTLPLTHTMVGPCLDGLTGTVAAEVPEEYKQSRAAVATCLRQILCLVTFLASDDAHLSSGKLEGRQPRPVPTRTKKGEKFFPPQEPRVWQVRSSAESPA